MSNAMRAMDFWPAVGTELWPHRHCVVVVRGGRGESGACD